MTPPGSYRTIARLAALLVLAMAAAGCSMESKARSEARARAAFQAGQQSGWQMQHGSTPGITVLGEVRNHKVLWAEGLTLNQAIVHAEYTGFLDPKKISILRAGERYDIDPKSLLRGEQDPILEPGDVIEIGR